MISERPTNVRWLVFGLASAASFLLYLHRYTWGIIKVAVGEEFGWKDSELGWVASFFGRMGGAASFLLFGTLMLGTWHLPWRTALGWLTAAGCAFAVLLYLLFRNTPRVHPWANEA